MNELFESSISYTGNFKYCCEHRNDTEMNTVYFKGNYRFVPEGGSDVLSYQGAQ